MALPNRGADNLWVEYSLGAESEGLDAEALQAGPHRGLAADTWAVGLPQETCLIRRLLGGRKAEPIEKQSGLPVRQKKGKNVSAELRNTVLSCY